MAGTLYPGALDNGTSMPDPSANSDTAAFDHSGLHDTVNAAVKGLEAKVGVTASTPTTGKVLTGGATPGTSTWVDPAPAGVWGAITGTLSAQTDLATALNAKLALGGGTMTGPLTLAADPTTSLQPASKQYVDARTLGSNAFTFNETPTGTVDGSNLIFITVAAYVGLSLEVFINGLQQNRTSDYVETTPGSGIFTFVVAPLTGDAVRVSYQFTNATAGNAATVGGKAAAELSQVGDLIMSMRTTAGTNRLFMAGGTFNKSDWPALWALQGSHPAYFTASTTLTFTLADMRQRVPVGKTASGTFPTLGATGGEETHILTTTEMPSHSHSVNDPGHNHALWSIGQESNVYTLGGTSTRAVLIGGTPNSGNGITGSRGTGISLNNNGSDGAHNNLQPYIVVNYEVIAA